MDETTEPTTTALKAEIDQLRAELAALRIEFTAFAAAVKPVVKDHDGIKAAASLTHFFNAT